MTDELKAAILDRLSYPRRLIENGFLPRECHANRIYRSGDGVCGACRERLECRWLNLLDETGAGDSRSLQGLREMLGFAVEYVVTVVLQESHDPRSCRCDSCRWVRESEKLMSSLPS